MEINNFALTEKCFWNCLNCKKPKVNSQNLTANLISFSSYFSLDVFSHYTLDLALLKDFLSKSAQQKHQTAIFYQGLLKDKLINLSTDYLFFPFFSISANLHDEFVGNKSFDNLVSSINDLPSTQKRIAVFFVNKDNFSECADLPVFRNAINSKIWVIPINLFTDNDFNSEDVLYLKRLNLYENIYIHPLHLRKLKSPNPKCYLHQTGFQLLNKLDYLKHSIFFIKMFGIKF